MGEGRWNPWLILFTWGFLAMLVFWGFCGGAYLLVEAVTRNLASGPK
jgi:hypothetical protein